MSGLKLRLNIPDTGERGSMEAMWLGMSGSAQGPHHVLCASTAVIVKNGRMLGWFYTNKEGVVCRCALVRLVFFFGPASQCMVPATV